MYALPEKPAFRCKDANGFYSPPGKEWFYHFRQGGYTSILYVDLIASDDDQRNAILTELKRIGLAGHQTDDGFRVYGYTTPGQSVGYF